MTEYVVGFLFNPEMDKVVLIEKNRPEWQKGFLNGVGGHIEEGEDPYFTMRREFVEETGLHIINWTAFCEITGKSWKCYFFFSTSENYLNVQDITDEHIRIIKVDNLFYEPSEGKIRGIFQKP